jgi:O-acetylhomoserine/O-acetylserine sulfhydrylase-like pyridoxal-dependent enzyme
MGLRRNPAEGFEAFRVRLRNSLAADPSLGLSPESACVIDQTFEAYVQLRYGKNPPNADNIAKLVSNLRKIRLV